MQNVGNHAAASGKCDAALPALAHVGLAASDKTLKTASEQDLERAGIKPHQLRTFPYLPFHRRSGPDTVQIGRLARQ
jgi:hypothetical protein